MKGAIGLGIVRAIVAVWYIADDVRSRFVLVAGRSAAHPGAATANIGAAFESPIGNGRATVTLVDSSG